jgi:hypothetical protein
VAHVGDTHGDEWTTTLQLQEEKTFDTPKQEKVNFK